MAGFGFLNRQGVASTRRFKGPVAWLLGHQLVAGLKKMAAYSMRGDKDGLKDCMYAEPDREWADKDRDDKYTECDEDGVFWFDYMADSGDG